MAAVMAASALGAYLGSKRKGLFPKGQDEFG